MDDLVQRLPAWSELPTPKPNSETIRKIEDKAFAWCGVYALISAAPASILHSIDRHSLLVNALMLGIMMLSLGFFLKRALRKIDRQTRAVKQQAIEGALQVEASVDADVLVVGARNDHGVVYGAREFTADDEEAAIEYATELEEAVSERYAQYLQEQQREPVLVNHMSIFALPAIEYTGA